MSAELTGDLDFIKNVRGWPNYPFLPVKRSGLRTLTPENFGTVLADGIRPVPIVFMTTIFELADGSADLLKAKTIKYNSIEELLLEWTVD